MKTITGYKLFRQMKDGSLRSLFIDKSEPLPYNVWLTAGVFPTKGFAVRPGWHAAREPVAPHLSENPAGDVPRVWKRVQLRGVKVFKRPAQQGGEWLLADYMKILED